jgi:hypothetical protein
MSNYGAGVRLPPFVIGGSWFMLLIKKVELLVDDISSPAASAASSGAPFGSADAPVTAKPIRR